MQCNAMQCRASGCRDVGIVLRFALVCRVTGERLIYGHSVLAGQKIRFGVHCMTSHHEDVRDTGTDPAVRPDIG